MRTNKKSPARQSQRTQAIDDAMLPGRAPDQVLPLHWRIADQIGSAILSGRRATGSLLPKEMEVNVDLGVSRSAYREAVRMLAAKGLVESRPHVGTQVTHRRRWQMLDPDVLRWAFHNGPSFTFVQELFELRGILEPHAAELAAGRRNEEQLARMAAALADMARHGLGSADGRAADQRFHEEILVATGNQALMTLSASIGAAIHWTTVLKHQSTHASRDAIPDHRKLYEAISAKDPASAARAARELLQLALQDTHASLVVEHAKEQPTARNMKRKI